MIEVYIPKGVTKVEASTPLYQWDYGRKLRITGDDVPSACQVHFCDRTCDKTKVRIASPIDGGIEVAIPDDLLKNKYPINAFFYVTTTGAGYTVIHVHIPVIERKEPEAYIEPVPPTVQSQMEQMIASANAVLEDIEEKVGNYEELLYETITYAELEALIEEKVAKALEERGE